MLGSVVAIGTALPVWNYLSSLFVVPMTTEFGWSRGAMASASASAFFGSLAAPVVGKIADLFGARRVLTVGLIGYAAMIAALALQPGSLSAYTVIIMFHTMIGIGCGGAVFSRAVAGWFEYSRGLALGMTMTGVPIAAALITPALQWIIAAHGWRAGLFMLSGLAALVGAPMVLALIRERPAVDPAGEPVAIAGATGKDWSQIVRSPGFWLLALALLPINAAGVGILSAMVPILTDGGLTTPVAARLVSAFAIAVIVSRLGAGWLVDRFPAHIVAAAVAATPAIGCAMLLDFGGQLWRAALALAFIGVQQGAEIDLVGYLVARLFGMKNYASAYGVCVVFLGLSGAFGAAWFGRTFDAHHSYRMALGLAIPCYLAGGGMLLALRLAMCRRGAVAAQ